MRPSVLVTAFIVGQCLRQQLATLGRDQITASNTNVLQLVWFLDMKCAPNQDKLIKHASHGDKDLLLSCAHAGTVFFGGVKKIKGLTKRSPITGTSTVYLIKN